MPAYAKDGKVVCFFQSAQKFRSRYATFGFSDEANLDEGAMWPTSFALTELTAAEAASVGALVRKGVSAGIVTSLHDAKDRAVVTYTAPGDPYNDAESSFWERFGRATI